MFGIFYKLYLLYKWKKIKRRGECVRVNVSCVVDFMRELEVVGVRNLVLRWSSDVPLTVKQEAEYLEDVDLLIDIAPGSFGELARIASRYRGNVPCDLYGVSGCKGARYLNMPYYPPVLAEEIMGNRELHPSGYYCPDPERQFCSLAYHVVYHKGLRSGLPIGIEGDDESSRASEKYATALEKLGLELGVDVQRPYTLIGLHNCLKSRKWSMPYDLLRRWPARSSWHKMLINYEQVHLSPWAQQLPGLLIFFVRECAMRDDLIQVVRTEISNKFQVLDQVHLDKIQIGRVMRQVRGGDWYREDVRLASEPRVAMICYDHDPKYIKNGSLNNDSNPIINCNENLCVKNIIRKKIRDMKKMGSNGIHSSDDSYESQHMLCAIFDEQVNRMNHLYLDKVRNSIKSN